MAQERFKAISQPRVGMTDSKHGIQDGKVRSWLSTDRWLVRLSLQMCLGLSPIRGLGHPVFCVNKTAVSKTCFDTDPTLLK